MMSHNNLNEISRIISHALRHEPEKYGLILDKNGFVSINLLLETLKKTKPDLNITLGDIIQIVTSSEKKRHEIVGDKIRALYGHSQVSISFPDSIEPPNVLFHGTSPANIVNIMQKGLLPMSRSHVHLSTEISTALSVGKRKDKDPVVFQIDAKKAFLEGVNFYRGNDSVWLANEIPPQFILLRGVIVCACPISLK
jgi:putative RNA 2'-phosphotransferase